MYIQDPTPDTLSYMILGYTVAFIVMGLYVLSLYIRGRNLRQDISMLEEMEDSAVNVETGIKPALKKAGTKSGGSKSAKTVTKKTRRNY